LLLTSSFLKKAFNQIGKWIYTGQNLEVKFGSEKFGSPEQSFINGTQTIKKVVKNRSIFGRPCLMYKKGKGSQVLSPKGPELSAAEIANRLKILELKEALVSRTKSE